MKRLAWGGLLVAALLGGCVMNAQLRAKAARDLSCDEKAIRTEGVEGWDYFARATGCGRQSWYGFDGARWISPTERAAFELNCPLEEMTVTPLDRSTIRVTGCDQKADYTLVDAIGGAKWVLRRTDNPLSLAPRAPAD